MRYCKSTIFQANHNSYSAIKFCVCVVCDTAKVRFFKQITTEIERKPKEPRLFAILQKYDFSSKSQQPIGVCRGEPGCLRYCKSTIFQANHNRNRLYNLVTIVVCDTAKVRFFKQITTLRLFLHRGMWLFAILQKYDFSSKSQQLAEFMLFFQVVCDTAKVRFFKQITT